MRLQSARELVRQSLWSADEDEDDGMEGYGEDEGMEEEEEVRPGRRRHRNPFIDDEWGVSKMDAKTTEASALSTSCHPLSNPLT